MIFLSIGEKFNLEFLFLVWMFFKNGGEIKSFMINKSK